MPKTPDPETDTQTPVLPRAEKNPQMVQVVITKFGAGQVSTGEHIAGEGDIYAQRGDKLVVSKRIAESLEVRGLAEIVE